MGGFRRNYMLRIQKPNSICSSVRALPNFIYNSVRALPFFWNSGHSTSQNDMTRTSSCAQVSANQRNGLLVHFLPRTKFVASIPFGEDGLSSFRSFR
jgi:hypothetical protein